MSKEKTDRNQKIVEEKQAGKSYDYLAKKYNLHYQRIVQIIKNYRFNELVKKG